MRLAQDLRSRKIYATNKLPRLTAHLMKHKTKSILRPRTTSEGQKWMILKREHPCLVLFPLEIMFSNTRDLLQIEDSVLFSVHDHRSETFVARIEYSEIFDGK